MNKPSLPIKPKPILLYGATGFSGIKIATRLADHGVEMILAGRNPFKLARFAEQLNMPWRAVSLENSQHLDQLMAQCSLVLNMAGPFIYTAEPMINAALHNGVHYLDLAGEWPIFHRAIHLDKQAKHAGVMLMPGIGFTLAVSDCLLAMAAQKFSSIELLRLAISMPDLVTNGTFRSMLEMVDTTVWIRSNGELRKIPVGSLNRYFYFGKHLARTTAVNWPDVFTAGESTGVRNIEAYAEMNLLSEAVYRLSGCVAPLLKRQLIKKSLSELSSLSRTATKQPRESAGFMLTVEAVDRWRRSSFVSLKTRDGYTVTTDIATRIVTEVLAGHLEVGFMTPGKLFGPDLLLQIPSIQLVEEAK